MMSLEASGKVAAGVAGAIRTAARQTGTDFEYLLKTAQRESNLKPTAKSPRSSATGLFQFLDQTWLATLKSAGPALGYAAQAAQIEQAPSGRYYVADPAQRKAILALRNDPVASSVMAGAFTRQNADYLQERIGREPSAGELYIAHFLGAGGAAQMIRRAEATPDAKAADLFPRAARANRSIFYGPGGQPRTLAQVYAVLVAKHQNIGGTRLAAAAPPPATTASVPAQEGPPTPSARAAEPGPVFHTLFRSDRDTALSPVVESLWGAQPQAPAREPAAPQPQNLFLGLLRS